MFNEALPCHTRSVLGFRCPCFAGVEPRLLASEVPALRAGGAVDVDERPHSFDSFAILCEKVFLTWSPGCGHGVSSIWLHVIPFLPSVPFWAVLRPGLAARMRFLTSVLRRSARILGSGVFGCNGASHRYVFKLKPRGGKHSHVSVVQIRSPASQSIRSFCGVASRPCVP